jgi:hypothetical protein
MTVSRKLYASVQPARQIGHENLSGSGIAAANMPAWN